MVPVVIWQYNMYPWAWLTDCRFCGVIHLSDCISKRPRGVHNTLGSHVEFFASYDITHVSATNDLLFVAFFCKGNSTVDFSSLALRKFKSIIFADAKSAGGWATHEQCKHQKRLSVGWGEKRNEGGGGGLRICRLAVIICLLTPLLTDFPCMDRPTAVVKGQQQYYKVFDKF